MKRIFLIRHPHVQVAEANVCYGRSEVGLSRLGREQLRALVDFMGRRYELDGVYSSDLARARQAALALARSQGVRSLRVLPELREIDCGCWEGLAYAQIKRRYPDSYRRWFDADDDFVFPGGEKMADFRRRVLRGFEKIVAARLSEKSPENVAVLTHAGVNRMIFMHLLGLDWRAARCLAQDFACLNIVECYPDGGVSLKLLNGTLY